MTSGAEAELTLTPFTRLVTIASLEQYTSSRGTPGRNSSRGTMSSASATRGERRCPSRSRVSTSARRCKRLSSSVPSMTGRLEYRIVAGGYGGRRRWPDAGGLIGLAQLGGDGHWGAWFGVQSLNKQWWPNHLGYLRGGGFL